MALQNTAGLGHVGRACDRYARNSGVAFILTVVVAKHLIVSTVCQVAQGQNEVSVGC